MVCSNPQTQVAYNKQHLCLSLLWVWISAKVPRAGTRGSSLCLSRWDRDEGAVATWSEAKSQHTSIFKASACVTSARRPSAKANRRSCLGGARVSMLLFWSEGREPGREERVMSKQPCLPLQQNFARSYIFVHLSQRLSKPFCIFSMDNLLGAMISLLMIS